MSRALRMVVGGALALGVVLGIGSLTRLEYTATPADRAELRLAWRARVPRVEECRRLTRAEREALPVHMRREVVCEGRVSSYRLEIVVDGTVRHRSVVEGAGARGDRPLYVFEALALEPGRHAVRVAFERIGADAGPTASASGDRPPAEVSEPVPGRSPRGGTVPDRLVLEERLELGSREVVLVTYDADARALVAGRPD
ncbi:MAG: hypothetical protein GWM90_32180 [Gemmatimonadetes bacterium]|nr:hypothetical protein [Gemmatimonadota bacterium]NIQ59944.1 hypothetical protein [Gemmatimonadota bacterium]NIU80146.1 hypothetical protein [Gammaproteobacteria bacterium]NIX48548.1 hypothetical protein [Gemmatimonadota bacterium]NIY12995.1 hypothetical protein [Gemmatimonadota bacterium]